MSFWVLREDYVEDHVSWNLGPFWISPYSNKDLERCSRNKWMCRAASALLSASISLPRSTVQVECLECLFAYSVAQQCLTLCNPTGCSPPCFSVQRISQTSTLEQVAISSSRGSSHLGTEFVSPALASGSSTTEPLRKRKVLRVLDYFIHLYIFPGL